MATDQGRFVLWTHPVFQSIHDSNMGCLAVRVGQGKGEGPAQLPSPRGVIGISPDSRYILNHPVH